MNIEKTQHYINIIRDEISSISLAKDIESLNASYITIHIVSSILKDSGVDSDVTSYIYDELLPSLDIITNYHLVRLANETTKTGKDAQSVKYTVGLCLQSIKGDENSFKEERDLISSLYKSL